ncbi:MAG TPA: hypothetical protein VLT81_11160 [Chondromyces sp.]|nr:hypothetical protein [Chondromyces sp.]
MNRARALIAAVLMVCGAFSAHAVETRRWVVDTADELLEGRGQGVAVTPEGLLQWAPGWSAGPSFDEPVVMAGARAADGSLIVGTSHPARLYRVRGEALELLAEVPAEQITALLVRDSGAVVLATVAPGVIFEWSEGELREAGRLAEGGIWDLALFAGEVVAAAGPPAALYRLAERGLERWLELPDVHARCLAVADGNLLVGTSGKGLVLGVDAGGRLAILADSPFTEISDLAAGGGAVWAAALVGEPVSTAPAAGDSSGDQDDNEAEAKVSAGADLKLPKVNGTTATSEILRLTPQGGLISVHRFTKEVASAVAWDGEGLLVGTGWEGELWRFVADGGTRLATVDAVQVVGIVGGGEALLTQGPGGVLWRDRGPDRRGSFRSAPRQFEQPVQLGEFRVEPSVDGARIRFRSGISAQPDDTWLEWSEWLPAAAGMVPLPPSRAVQWELELPATPGDPAAVERVEVAAVELNLPPRIASLTVEEPGVIFLAAPPSSGPVIEAVSPDLAGIFTVIDESEARNNGSTKGRKFYRTGYRTVSWEASDPNNDALRFVLELESRDGFRLPVRERLTGTQIGVDTGAVPDGSYRFRLTASDLPDNPEGALETSRSSRWFTVDNSPPSLRLEREGDSWVAVARDASSPIVRAEWSRNGANWESLAPEDGLLDGREERFRFAAEPGRHLVVVRVVDRQHNKATAGATEE